MWVTWAAPHDFLGLHIPVNGVGLGIAASLKAVGLESFPFMNRMMLVFVVSLAMAMLVSILRPAGPERDRIVTSDVSFGTSTSFNVMGLGVILILIALYATWW
jgi:SSS family solute:Na+ symporter